MDAKQGLHNVPTEKNWRAIVFDLDGTLWDSTATVTLAWQEVGRGHFPHGPQLEQKDVASIMGLTHAEIFKRLFPGFSKEDEARLSKVLYDEEVRALERYGGVLYPGVREGLPKLAARFPLYIVSNCRQPYLEAFFMTTGLGLHFKDWECHGRTGLTKAENISRLCNRNRLEKAIYVGDTAGDQIAATRAGLRFLHARYGFGSPAHDCPAADTFEQLVEYLLG